MKKVLLTSILSFMMGAIAFGQIPNAGFESWSSNEPVDWSTSNSITSPFSITGCTKGAPGKASASYLILTSKDMFGAIMPGLAAAGKVDFMNDNSHGGFAFAHRPTTFNGSYKYVPTGSDNCIIYVVLSKWNPITKSRDEISSALFESSLTATSWTSFSLNFIYQSDEIPDTATILLSSSSNDPQDGSALSIDQLSFGGIAAVNEIAKNTITISVYPNPSSTQITIDLKETAKIQLYDVLGNVVYEENTQGAGKNNIDMSGLSKGNYFLKVSSNNMVDVQKIVVQ